jgi:hypothetical protein
MSHPEQKFVSTISREQNKAYFALPFQPDDVWGKKPVHHVTGLVGGCRYRGKISAVNSRPAILLGPAWLRDRPFAVGDEVEINLSPEGPQRGDLDPDLAEALTQSPQAAAFFDSLAQFYRKGYLTWISATKKSPAERQRRIAATVRCLEAGLKERPKP